MSDEVSITIEAETEDLMLYWKKPADSLLCLQALCLQCTILRPTFG